MIKFQMKFALLIFLVSVFSSLFFVFLFGGRDGVQRMWPFILFISGFGGAFGACFSIMFAGEERRKQWDENRKYEND